MEVKFASFILLLPALFYFLLFFLSFYSFVSFSYLILLKLNALVGRYAHTLALCSCKYITCIPVFTRRISICFVDHCSAASSNGINFPFVLTHYTLKAEYLGLPWLGKQTHTEPFFERFATACAVTQIRAYFAFILQIQIWGVL